MRDVWRGPLRACGYLLVTGAAGLAGLILLPLSLMVAPWAISPRSRWPLPSPPGRRDG